MTNNTDEFDQEQFDAADATEEARASSFEPKQGGLSEWTNKPIVKLLAIMAVVGVALAGALGAFSSEKKPNVSTMTETPGIQEAPGGSASQFFIEQNDKANLKRVEQALNRGGSAMPTPVGKDSSLTQDKKDPLLEFKAETERMRRAMEAEKQQSDQKVQLLQQQMTQQQVQMRQMQMEPEDDSLAQAMQRQMQQLMDSWAPKGTKVVNGVIPLNEPAKPETAPATAAPVGASLASAQIQQKAKVIVPAGTVSYVQLLTEANSDVPGPILAQILSGPLAGGRAIGSFQVSNDYLVITFKSVTLKGKQYSIDGLALDPNTTLGGLATEVDHRYFIRVVLPAAGSFVSAFGEALSETDSTTTAAEGAVFQDKAKKGMKEALYSGAGAIGETVSEFFKAEANATQTLVRVAVGTPMGLFFLAPVTDDTGSTYGTLSPMQEAMLQGYQQAMPGYGYGMMNPVMDPTGQMLGQAVMTPPAGLAAPSNKTSTGGSPLYQTAGSGGMNLPGVPPQQQKVLNSVLSSMGNMK